MIADYPWKPFTLATDTQDNLLVIFRYDPQPGYLVNGKQETAVRLPDDNPMYSGWGNSGWSAWGYSFNPDNVDATMKPMPRVVTAGMKNIQKVIHPSSRWRGDFDKVVASMPEYSFVAPDGVTIIPDTYDLGRSCALTVTVPGQSEPVYIVNEMNKTTVQLSVGGDGRLTEQGIICPYGQYCNVTDADGNVYVADGEIFVYDKYGKEQRRIQIEERPISLAIGGRQKDMLFVTTSSSFYGIKIR